jgi:hypothetical protein
MPMLRAEYDPNIDVLFLLMRIILSRSRQKGVSLLRVEIASVLGKYDPVIFQSVPLTSTADMVVACRKRVRVIHHKKL